MKNLFLTLLIFIAMPAQQLFAQLVEVAQSNEVWNGVTVSEEGRIFVNFPRIEGDAGARIGEVLKDGSVVPFPSAEWNDWRPGKDLKHKLVRTNSLRIGPDGFLWIVDTGTPQMGKNPLPGAAKLVAVDLKKNAVVRVIPLDPVMKAGSFIDDLRIYGGHIFLTDAGEPGLVIMDYKTGKGRRVLEGSKSTTDERSILAEGVVMKSSSQAEVRIHADQLEISPDGKTFYFQPASGPLYKVPVAALLNDKLSAAELEAQVSQFFDTPSTGGTAIDAAGNIYVSDVDHSQIIKITPDGKSETVIADVRLLWCDAMWIGEDGYLYLPVGQLNRLAAFQDGKSAVKPPLYIFKVKTNSKPIRS